MPELELGREREAVRQERKGRTQGTWEPRSTTAAASDPPPSARSIQSNAIRIAGIEGARHSAQSIAATRPGWTQRNSSLMQDPPEGVSHMAPAAAQDGLAVQLAMNPDVEPREVIQRTIVDSWETDSRISGEGFKSFFGKGRSAALQEIDASVVRFREHCIANRHAEVLQEAEVLRGLIEAWRQSKGGFRASAETKRADAMDRLEADISVRVSDARRMVEGERRGEYGVLAQRLTAALQALAARPPATPPPAVAPATTHPAAALPAAIPPATGPEEEAVREIARQMKAFPKAQLFTPYTDAELDAMIADPADASARLTHFQDQQGLYDRTRANFESALHLPDDMAPYAKFNTVDIKMDRFRDDVIAPITDITRNPHPPAAAATDPAPSRMAMLSHKDANGLVAPAASAYYRRADQSEYEGKQRDSQLNRAKMNLCAADPVAAANAAHARDAHRNEITGRTELPELENLAAPNALADAPMREVRNLSGTDVTILHNLSDVHGEAKIQKVSDALALIRNAGFIVPAFELHLPKYGRSIDPTSGNPEADNATSAAEMHPPNRIHLSSSFIDNPKVETGLSSRVDPSGVGTIVHELGHYMHFQTSGAKFDTLSFAAFRGLAPNGQPLSVHVGKMVSQYGGGNPREFVAEMFVGIVYRQVDIQAANRFASREQKEKTAAHLAALNDDAFLMRIYQAFGGAMPAAAADADDAVVDADDVDVVEAAPL